MTKTYEGRAAAAAWGEGVTRHATLMGWGRQCRIRSPPPRIPDRLPTWSLGLTWLPPKSCHGYPSGVGLDEPDRPI
ncbi:hypothetical protein GW17_00012067, partial [Ensete ventricosum]